MMAAVIARRKLYRGILWRLSEEVIDNRVCLPCKIETTVHIRKLHGDFDKTTLKNYLRDGYLTRHKYELGAVTTYGLLSVFKNSWPVVPPVSENFRSLSTYWVFEWFFKNTDSMQRREMFGLISFDIFEKGYLALERYVNDETQTPEITSAINALEKFFCYKGRHELVLSEFLSKDLEESEMVALLTQHLFSQLLPCPSNYFLGDHYTERHSCPCGCGIPIKYGLTHLGTPQLFHGNADIVLFPRSKDLFKHRDNSTAAIFTMEKNKKWGLKKKDDWNSDDELDEDDAVGECNARNFCHEDMMRQLCKQAIALSLCQLRRLTAKPNNVSGIPMIPVCAITKDSYKVALYNAEYDFLLKTLTPLKLFENETFLAFSAVVDLWLLINHSLFCVEQDQEILDSLKGTCNLIPQLGTERFQSIVNDSEWLLAPKLSNQRYLRPLDESQFSSITKKSKYPRSQNEKKSHG